MTYKLIAKDQVFDGYTFEAWSQDSAKQRAQYMFDLSGVSWKVVPCKKKGGEAVREIKFRAWNKKDKKMFIPSKIYFDDWGQLWKIPYGFGMIFQANMILMQYTGLKDKNSKEIYEGDITRQHLMEEHYAIYPVEWMQSDYHTGFYLVKTTPYDYSDLGKERASKLEVIGNIYESPDLLEGK